MPLAPSSVLVPSSKARSPYIVASDRSVRSDALGDAEKFGPKTEKFRFQFWM